MLAAKYKKQEDSHPYPFNLDISSSKLRRNPFLVAFWLCKVLAGLGYARTSKQDLPLLQKLQKTLETYPYIETMQQEITPLRCCPISEKDIIVICKHSSRSKIDVYATDVTSLQHPLYTG